MNQYEIDTEISKIMDHIADQLGDEVHDFLCDKEVPHTLFDAIQAAGLIEDEG